MWAWGRALRGRGAAEDGDLARPDSPSRCTLPITALRVMPPSSAAIWLADNPSVQSFFSVSTRSSVQVMPQILASRRGGEVQTESHCGPWQRPVGPTHTRATDLRYDLSAARSVVFDDEKATIWRESGARVRRACFHIFCPRIANASTLICALVQCVNVYGGCHAVLGHVDSRLCRNTIPYGAARRGGTFRFHGLSTWR